MAPLSVWQEALSEYFAEYGPIGTGPDPCSPHFFPVSAPTSRLYV